MAEQMDYPAHAHMGNIYDCRGKEPEGSLFFQFFEGVRYSVWVSSICAGIYKAQRAPALSKYKTFKCQALREKSFQNYGCLNIKTVVE